MEYLQIGLLAAGIALLVVGYRKDRRNQLLLAAILLFLAGALGEFANGFMQGYHEVRT
jgi:lipoprotein signal peptidase